jgi:hypothetical protein
VIFLGGVLTGVALAAAFVAVVGVVFKRQVRTHVQSIDSKRRGLVYERERLEAAKRGEDAGASALRQRREAAHRLATGQTPAVQVER